MALLMNVKLMLIEAIRCRSLLIETCVWAPLPMLVVSLLISFKSMLIDATRCRYLLIDAKLFLVASGCFPLLSHTSFTLLPAATVTI